MRIIKNRSNVVVALMLIVLVSSLALALGATRNATCGPSALGSTGSSRGVVESLDQAIELFADVIRNRTFPQAEVDQYKTRTLAQLEFQRSIPQFLAAEQFNRAIYGMG